MSEVEIKKAPRLHNLRPSLAAGLKRLTSLYRPWMSTVLIGIALLLTWHFRTSPSTFSLSAAQNASLGQSPIPTPSMVAVRGWELMINAFDYSNPNNLGIAWHLYYSLKRVLFGFALSLMVGVPLGFLIGLLPSVRKALNPFIQILRPVSPLAWIPIALYTLKDSGASAIFVIFISALWPILMNTIAGASQVRTEWLNVARVLGLSNMTKITKIVFPASVPMILTGTRVSIGIAWFVIVAAEIVVGQNGVGYFIWNEWNNLQLSSMLVAVLLIGLVGLGLDKILAVIERHLSFQE